MFNLWNQLTWRPIQSQPCRYAPPPLLTFSNRGMRERFPWLPSRNDNANAADIVGTAKQVDGTAKQIKLAFNLTSTVTKLTHASNLEGFEKYLRNKFSDLSPPLPIENTTRMIIFHFNPSLQQPVLSSYSAWMGSHLGLWQSLAAHPAFPAVTEYLRRWWQNCLQSWWLISDAEGEKEGKSLERHYVSLYNLVQWTS